MANKRETTLQELMNVTKENADIITSLINYGISKNILTESKKQSNVFYTLIPYGEETEINEFQNN